MNTERLSRQPIVIANWKMYLGAAESIRAAQTVRRALSRSSVRRIDVVLCPAFPLLPAVRDVLKTGAVRLGAQDVHQEASGPFTGDVSADHLRGLVTHVIVGHSERRRFHGETDDSVREKARRALRAGLYPILCVGETAEERDRGETVAKVRQQVERIIRGLPGLSLARCVFAYEPIWAISPEVGKPSAQPDPADAAHIMRLVRKVASDQVGRGYAERLRVVYGGSVQASTVRPFVSEPGTDGVLVGSASTKPREFVAIVREVLACHS